MSLLLARQTPVVATGLEEAPSPVLGAVLAAVVLLGSVGEEIPAVAFVGEEDAAVVVAPVVAASPTWQPLEDFAGSLPLEETTSIWLPPPPRWISASFTDEEFGLPHPIEETSGEVGLVTVLPLLPSPPTEDFAGSLPIEEATEETSSVIPVSLIAPMTPAVVPEDFAGSLPLEEPPGFVWIDTPPVWLTVTFDEEFGLPHVSEEGQPALVFDRPVASVPPPTEEFSGSLPIEEPAEETSQFIPIIAVAASTPIVVPEEFAGSLPLEEASSFWLPRDPPVWIAWTTDEEFGGAHPIEEGFADVATIVSLVQILAPPDEEFAGSLPIEEPADEVSPFVFVTLPILKTPNVVPEDFAGSLPIEEDSRPPFIFFRPMPSLFDVEEIVPQQPPPPPPPPPRPTPPSRHIRAVGGSGAIQIDRPWCPPGHTWEWDKYHWICVPQTAAKVEADYAILPLVDEVTVKALGDGVVETFKDKSGKLVVRLTADDGTTYFYAKVQKVKVGRVKKGDVIGVSADAAIAPKALPPASQGAHQPAATSTPQEPKGVFGVLPVAPLPKSPTIAPPLPRTARLRSTQQMQATMRHAPPSVGSTIIVGIGIVGAAIVVAAMIRAVRKKPFKKKKRKRRRRR